MNKKQENTENTFSVSQKQKHKLKKIKINKSLRVSSNFYKHRIIENLFFHWCIKCLAVYRDCVLKCFYETCFGIFVYIWKSIWKVGFDWTSWIRSKNGDSKGFASWVFLGFGFPEWGFLIFCGFDQISIQCLW